MMNRIVWITAMFFVLVYGAAAQEADTTAAQEADTAAVQEADTTAVEDTLTQSQQYVVEGDTHHDMFHTESALSWYIKAYEADSTNAEAIWKIARELVDRGEAAEEDDDIKAAYKEAEAWARKGVRVAPDNSKVHSYLAIAVGRVALQVGGKTKVELSKEVKSESLKAIELDPENDTPYHVLARWHREVANLNWFLKAAAKIIYGGLPPATEEEAVVNFKKAIALKPDWINHHLELGITYQGMDMNEEARAEFEEVLKLPVQDKDDADHKAEAEKLLKEL